MNANELADKLMSSLTMEYDCDKYMEQAATMLRQQQTKLEKLQGLLREYTALHMKQQAEIEALKTYLIVEQEHNERMVEDRSKYEALAHAGGVEAGKELAQAEIEALKNRNWDLVSEPWGFDRHQAKEQTVMEVMSEHCTCYKLGYSQLNNYRKVNNENNNEAA